MKWGTLDFVVHAIAFSDKNELKGKYVDTTLPNFLNSMNISVFSFTAVCQRAAKLMKNGGSLVTLTYYGAEKVMPHYNVMGVAKAALEASVRYLAVDLGGDNIRVNAISAGPIKTLAASGIGDFRYILKWNADERIGAQVTTGTPIGLLIGHVDQRSKRYHYSDVAVMHQGHHADYTYDVKYGLRDWSKAPGRARDCWARVAAGARKIVPAMRVRAALVQMGPHAIDRASWDWEEINDPFFCPMPSGQRSMPIISTACARPAPRSAPSSRWW